jgi:FAD/FMN-containing dehydrogenase
MISRRQLLKQTSQQTAASAPYSTVLTQVAFGTEPILVNDVHSQLNQTRVSEVLRPTSSEEVQAIVHRARKERKSISIAGGRHAMGGQQFGVDTLLVDVTKLNRILHLDRNRGLLEVEAGIEWPQLIDGYLSMQKGNATKWGIAQKQTGADRLSIGGTIAANGHGRGLTMKPFVSNVVSFDLVDADGNIRHCTRSENQELFSLVNGGYGLFGIVARTTLQLIPRRKVQRMVEIRTVDDLILLFDKRIGDGFVYGDFQFSIERDSEDFLHKGVFSCYRPVSNDTLIPEQQKELAEQNWHDLLYLAHTDQKKAFDTYSKYYMATNGQVYWSDTHQLSIYPNNYHPEIDRRLHAPYPATEIITEINVPRPRLKDFFAEVRDDFRKNKVELIYGTVRLIERDTDTFLPWAKQSYASTVFNLHTVHSPEGMQHSAEAFRRLIDMAVKRGGTYFLTYHRYAGRNQVECCYPQFAQFLRHKLQYDPEDRFQSDWYRHYKAMFA